MWDISWSKWEVDRLRHFYILPPPIRSIRQITWHSSYGTCLKVSKRFRKTETWQVFVFLHSIQPHQKSSPIQKKRDLLPCDLVADSDALYIILPETNSSPLKNRPLKVWRFLLETHHFQGRAVSLREGNFVQTKLLGLHKFTSKPGQLSSDLREFLDLTPFPSAQVNLFFSEKQLRPRVTGRVKKCQDVYFKVQMVQQMVIEFGNFVSIHVKSVKLMAAEPIWKSVRSANLIQFARGVDIFT